MLNWPNIKMPIMPFSEELEDVALVSLTENGMVVSRPKFTRPRNTFSLQWTALPTVDYIALKQFYASVLGGSNSFIWPHPITGTLYEVRFSGAFSFQYDNVGLWSGSITLIEV